jgi:hypothetical protein
MLLEEAEQSDHWSSRSLVLLLARRAAGLTNTRAALSDGAAFSFLLCNQRPFRYSNCLPPSVKREDRFATENPCLGRFMEP